MIKLLFKTKGNASPSDKPRVYFTCHPGDFALHFDWICQAIFKSHNCAVYYTEDFSAAFDDEDKVNILERSNLLVVPVTFKLLSEPNRAMDADIPFALEKRIPVLPIMMESNLDGIYSRPDKFGDLHYLYPFATDTSAVSFEEKLKKYLESVLISDETVKRIRAAFDAYIFLSYRKKDRTYANQLIRMIHNNPEYRNIAVWYDEFLTPGESFRENIDKILADSKLYALLVTPNLLEDANYVMANEYPAALRSGIHILPAEMEDTDRGMLAEKYKNLPEIANPYHDEAFRKRLANIFSHLAITADSDDPRHNFLIGLAYLDGIDMEVNRDRALELITSAANANLPEAMEKLYDMYKNGTGVPLSYTNMCYWAERLLEFYTTTYGETHENSRNWMHMLSMAYYDAGDYAKSIALRERVYALEVQLFGEKHPDNVSALGSLAMYYKEIGQYAKALELAEAAYTLLYGLLEENNLSEQNDLTPKILSVLADCHEKLEQYETALEFYKKAYTLRVDCYGEHHPDTLLSLNDLATYHYAIGDYPQALELGKQVYAYNCELLGQSHPTTITALTNLASYHHHMGDTQKAYELSELALQLRMDVLGEEHPSTIYSLHNLAYFSHAAKDYPKAVALGEQAYALSCKTLGKDNLSTIETLHNLALHCEDAGEVDKHLHLLEEEYLLKAQFYGKHTVEALYAAILLANACNKHNRYEKAGEAYEAAANFPSALLEEEGLPAVGMRNTAASFYCDAEHYDKAAELYLQVYESRLETLGDRDTQTITPLHNAAYSLAAGKHYNEAAELYAKAYTMKAAALGESHASTLKTLTRLGDAYYNAGNTTQAAECYNTALRGYESTLGAHHEDTLAIKTKLESI